MNSAPDLKGPAFLVDARRQGLANVLRSIEITAKCEAGRHGLPCAECHVDLRDKYRDLAVALHRLSSPVQ